MLQSPLYELVYKCNTKGYDDKDDRGTNSHASHYECMIMLIKMFSDKVCDIKKDSIVRKN